MSNPQPLPAATYDKCSPAQLAQALDKKVEGAKRAHEQSVSIDTAILKHLQNAETETKRLTHELGIYRQLGAIEQQFEDGIKVLKEEYKALEAREVALREVRDAEKRVCQEVLPLLRTVLIVPSEVRAVTSRVVESLFIVQSPSFRRFVGLYSLDNIADDVPFLVCYHLDCLRIQSSFHSR
jgi:hypothetical protein